MTPSVLKIKTPHPEDAAFFSRKEVRLDFSRNTADGGFDDPAGFDALRADAHHADAAVDERADALQVREEAAGGDTRRFKTDTACFFGDTAAGDLFAGQRFFIAKFANSSHFGLPRRS